MFIVICLTALACATRLSSFDLLIGFNVRNRRAVAQSGSALPWGGRGREFKSPRPDQHKPLHAVAEAFALFMGIQQGIHFRVDTRINTQFHGTAETRLSAFASEQHIQNLSPRRIFATPIVL